LGTFSCVDDNKTLMFK